MTKNFPYKIHQLKNGLRVLHIRNSGYLSTFLQITGKGGTRSEKDNEIGAAHFLEHLFFDGTTKRPSSIEANQYIEAFGGVRGGTTRKESIDYRVKILNEYSKEGFDFLSDIFLNSTLKEVEKERKVITQEVGRSASNAAACFEKSVWSVLYPGLALGRSIFDDEKNLPQMTTELLTLFRDRLYNSRNFILTVVADLDESKLIEQANKYFASLKDGEEVIYQKAQLSDEKIVRVFNEDFKQARIGVFFRGYDIKSSEVDYAELLAVLFCRSNSSRIHNRIRQQLHLAYEIKGGINANSDTGFFYVEAAVDEKNLQLTANEIFKEITKLLKEGIKEEELEKSKNKLISEFIFNLESPRYTASYFTDQLLWKNEIEPIDKRLERIRNAKVTDLMRVAEYIFSGNVKIVAQAKETNSLEIPD